MKNFIKRLSNLAQRQQSSILSAAALIMLSYGLSMLLGFVRDRLLLAYFFGCCKGALDAYRAAFVLPDTLFQLLVTGSLTAAFIPIYSKLLDTSKAKAFRMSSSVLNGLVVGFLFLGVVIFIFAPQLSNIITGDFTEDQLRLMTSLTRLMLAGQFFFLFSSFLTGINHSHQRFLLPAISPLLYNLSIIGGIILGAERIGLYAPAIGVLVGAFLHAGIQVPLVWKLGFRYRWDQWDFRMKEVRELGKLMIPRTLSSGVNQLEAIAAVFFTTSLTSGSYVLFSLAQMLMFLPIRLVGVPISQAAFPQLSKSFSRDKRLYVRLISDNILQILYFILPITAILLVLRVPIVRLAYGTANFPWEATLQTGYTLGFFTLAIPAQAINQLLIRGFYAQKDTRMPLLSGAVSMLIFLSLSWLSTFIIDWDQAAKGVAFVDWGRRSSIDWNLLGLALATSMASFGQLVMLFWLFNRRVKILTNSLVTPTSKLLLSALLTATCLWIPMWFLDDLVFDTTRVLPLIGLTVTATAIGLAVYFLLCHWLKVKEQDYILELIHKLPAMKKSIRKLRALTSLVSAPSGGLGDGNV